MRLREITEADYPVLFAMQNHAELHWQAAFSTHRTAEQSAAHLDRIRSLADTIILGIEVDGHLIGNIGKWVMGDEPELMYWIDPAHQRKGYATAAVDLFLREFEPRPFFAHVVSDNLASIKVLEKHGFIKFEEITSHSDVRNAEVQEFGLRLD